jgi:transcription-repair coupling factor (superfamily II helicase)
MNVAQAAVAIAEALPDHDVAYLADDEQQAEAIAAAVAAIAPHNPAVFLPSSDALPGDQAPASPANTGRRVAALQRLRRVQADADRPRLACIMSGEAAARRYAPPRAFDASPPVLTVGDPVDVEALAAELEQIGYWPDDRVDEPGEVAVRGDVIDIFPADAGSPVRIEIAEGRIAAIRAYDAATQRTTDERDCIEVGRAADPAIADAVPVLAHLPTGLIGLSDQADVRRRRFIALARDAAGRRGAALDAIDDEVWKAALDGWELRRFDAGEPVPRFVENRGSLAAMVRFAKPLLAEGRAFVLAGSARDLRFLRPKVAQRLGVELTGVTRWADAKGAVTLDMPVHRGFVDDRHVLVAAGDLLGSRAILGAVQSGTTDPLALAGAEIRVGDVVVHEDHGVGVVAGLEPAPDAGVGEMIALAYAGGGRRLVSIGEAGRVWRYGADADAVTLDKLDGSSWAKRRAAIDAAIAESARGLTELAAARAKLTAPVLKPDDAAYERFAGGFPFNETPDQARAISHVRDDLASGKPMDRLVIGDVGYGKTEVALRAAALAALGGHQAVVAAPTTVLVRQHLENFIKRFEGTGITVAGLSRLSTAAEKKAAKAGLADGSIGVVVGTGAVMGTGVDYAKLGLVIIDEEQRFGAADKARLRGNGDVHLLSLSATPIPRTLQMAMVGLQQMSVIATPPARRQPIRTSLDTWDDARIRTALLREQGRGGQSFVVVPRIEDLAPLSDKLRRIVPDLRVVEAHGKMRAADIDAVMVDFANGEGDVLLATNIIEAGLDVPRANTMIVHNADRFGLAQLHQLRGRVGRGNRRGQVVLLTAGEDAVGERTLKRLRALATFDRLGAGFEISTHDLDMRGGGDLIGETQAGHMKLIGTDLYQHLLAGALRAARGEPEEAPAPEINGGAAGHLPDAWIPEADIRLGLYVRLARITSDADLDAFEEELTDRFGPLPPQAEALVAQARIGLLARAAHIARIDAGPAAIALTPAEGFAADAKALGLEEKNGRLLLREETAEGERTGRIIALLEGLAE